VLPTLSLDSLLFKTYTLLCCNVSSVSIDSDIGDTDPVLSTVSETFAFTGMVVVLTN